jgi:hypothetical protein
LFAPQIYAELAQAVERRTENPGVPSASLGLGTILFKFNPTFIQFPSGPAINWHYSGADGILSDNLQNSLFF